MKNKLFIFFLLFPLFLSAEENFIALSQQAEALAEAHDYAAASKIYEQLLSQSLPDWQQARLFYNLGTIRLAQQKSIEALEFFEKIQPTDLSLPSFGRHLFLNEGIAFLQYAQTALPSIKAVFIEQSLKAFDQALQLECQLQKEENSSSCQPSLLLDQWIKTAQSQLQASQHQLSKENVNQEIKKSVPASILQQALEQAEQALQMFLRSKFTQDPSSEQMQAIVKQQQDVLSQAIPFIPAVLNAQKLSFQEKKDCPQSPWDQVIPLYDRGYRSAQAAAKQLDQSLFNSQSILAYQQQTIQDWQQALHLILSPPQPSASTTSQKLKENFGLLQEMYLQDQAQPEPKLEEMHSW